MRAGLDIARLWLRGPSEVFTIQVSCCLLYPGMIADKQAQGLHELESGKVQKSVLCMDG